MHQMVYDRSLDVPRVPVRIPNDAQSLAGEIVHGVSTPTVVHSNLVSALDRRGMLVNEVLESALTVVVRPVLEVSSGKVPTGHDRRWTGVS